MTLDDFRIYHTEEYFGGYYVFTLLIKVYFVVCPF